MDRNLVAESYTRVVEHKRWRSANGTIDSGRELFGDSTLLTQGARAGQTAANGFEALADLDSNQDGQFNSADAAFASVKLWKDANQDGISQSGELFSFAQLGVQSITVAGTASNVNLVDANGAASGNTQTLAGSFPRTNGQCRHGGTGVQLAAGEQQLLPGIFGRPGGECGCGGVAAGRRQGAKQ